MQYIYYNNYTQYTFFMNMLKIFRWTQKNVDEKIYYKEIFQKKKHNISYMF